MNEINVQPPQPIPYPDNEIIKKLYRFPILLYRLGLGKLISPYILILSTTGRRSGKTHRTPVEYFKLDNRIYIISGFNTKPDWYRNMLADPHVTINLGTQVLPRIARKPETDEEWAGVVAYLKASPISLLSDPALVNNLDDPQVKEAIKTWPVLTFDTTEETCPPPLESDLLWTWPLILLGAAFIILFGWLNRHH